MSRSLRLPMSYVCYGANPREGKRLTSRMLRRKVHQQLCHKGKDFDFCHIQDKNRGKYGSRDPNWGWDFFGDGVWAFNNDRTKITPRIKLCRK